MKEKIYILIIAFFSIFFCLKHNSFSKGDEKAFHFPQITHFVEEGFSPNYKIVVMMTPGSHIALATCIDLFGGLFSSDLSCARFVNALLTLILLLSLAAEFYSINPFFAIFAIVPICTSHYILYELIWIMTDNGALLWVTIAMSLLLKKPNLKKIWIISLTIGLAILWRQVHIWLFAPFFIYCYQYKINNPQNYWQLCFHLFFPVSLLFYFFYLWGGLYPIILSYSNVKIPTEILALLLFGIFFVISFSMRKSNLLLKKCGNILLQNKLLLLTLCYTVLLCGGSIKKNLNASFIFIISLFGCYSICYLMIFSQECWKILQKNKKIFILTVLLTTPIFFVSPKPWRWKNTTGGALWSIADFCPSINDYSLVFWILFPLGICSCLMWIYLIPKEQHLIFGCIFSSWICAHSLVPISYQRHSDVWILIFLGYLTVTKEKPQKSYLFGIITLSLVQISLSTIKYM